MFKRVWPGLALMTLAGCSSTGNHAPPPSAIAMSPAATGRFQSAVGREVDANAPLPDHWWRLYNDPRLDRLVEQALAANIELREAQANLDRAQAVLREAEAGRTLSTAVGGGVTLGRAAGIGTDLPGTVGYDLGLSASYPLDLNGRLKSAISASRADVETVTAARDYVRTAIAAATARAYGKVCAANYLLNVNRRVVASQQSTASATQRLFDAGRATAFDVSRARGAVESSEAALPAYEGDRQTALYLLATLLGRTPREYPADVGDCAALPSLDRPLPTGDGAALIRRRPDIRQAERTIAGDLARLDVATADLYPQVSIGGSVGLLGPLKGLGNGSAFNFGLGPLISWSFPNRPVVRARIAQAEASVQVDLASFDRIVIEALRQVETSLETFRRDAQTADALTRASTSASLSAEQAQRLYRFGRGDFLSLLDAQRNYASAEAARALATAQLLDDQITIFLALGGGWS